MRSTDGIGAFPLGPKCRRCRTSEAGCARINGCCPNCSHFRDVPGVPPPCPHSTFRIHRISEGIAPWAAQCSTCGHITRQQRLISVAVAEIEHANEKPARRSA